MPPKPSAEERAKQICLAIAGLHNTQRICICERLTAEIQSAERDTANRVREEQAQQAWCPEADRWIATLEGLLTELRNALRGYVAFDSAAERIAGLDDCDSAARKALKMYDVAFRSHIQSGD